MGAFVYVVVGITSTKEQDIFAIFSSEEKANNFKEALEKSESELVKIFKSDPVKYEVRQFTLN